jgi:hypothetical protein
LLGVRGREEALPAHALERHPPQLLVVDSRDEVGSELIAGRSDPLRDGDTLPIPARASVRPKDGPLRYAMGHGDTSVTQRVYTHLYKRERAEDAFRAAMSTG